MLFIAGAHAFEECGGDKSKIREICVPGRFERENTIS